MSFGKAALIRQNLVKTTKRYIVCESCSSYCSLWWVKLQTDRLRLSSTNAMSIWNKSSGHSLSCNQLSISTPGFRSLSLSSDPENPCHSCSHSWLFEPIRIKRNKDTCYSCPMRCCSLSSPDFYDHFSWHVCRSNISRRWSG